MRSWAGRVGLLLGLALLVVLGDKLGRTRLIAALVESPLPIACAAAYHLVPLALYTQSWRALLPARRPGFGKLLQLRWIGEAINSLLPVAQVGGDLARARRLVLVGVPAPEAGASMIGDMATGFSSLIAFAVLGALALLTLDGGGASETLLVRGGVVQIVLASVAALALVAAGLTAMAQRGVARIAARLPLWRSLTAHWKSLPGGAERLDGALRSLHREGRLAAAFGWHLAGWCSQVVETWLVLALLGHPLGWRAALVIESLVANARTAAFFVPGGIGVQEATVIGIARHLGLPDDAAAALGLIKRMRELATGAPGLVLWVWTGGRRAQAAKMVVE